MIPTPSAAARSIAVFAGATICRMDAAAKRDTIAQTIAQLREMHEEADDAEAFRKRHLHDEAMRLGFVVLSLVAIIITAFFLASLYL